MTNRLPPEIELSGWKMIAEYLGVSVREAQSWEKDAELPVRRMPGKKSRVWASRAELDSWKEQVSIPNAAKQRVTEELRNSAWRNVMPERPLGNLGGAITGQDGEISDGYLRVSVVAPPDTAVRPWVFSRPGRVTFWIGTALLVCVVAIGVVIRFYEPQVASAAAIGNALTAKGADGNVLWTHRFDYPFMERLDEAKWRIQVVDLNGDGQSEVLVATGFTDPTASHGPEELLCFARKVALALPP